MARKPRWPTVGVPQLVLLTGHNGCPFFIDDEDYMTFMGLLAEAAAESRCHIHAYGIVHDRAMLLCTPLTRLGVARMMQSTGRSYVPYFNTRYSRSGALWNGRYRAALVEPSSYTVTAYRVVDTLPGGHGGGISSRECHITDCPDPVIHNHPAFLGLGRDAVERGKCYRALCDEPLSERAVHQVLHAVVHGLVFGSEHFKDDIEATHRLRVRLGKPGRPRKPACLEPAPTLRRPPGVAVTPAEETAAPRAPIQGPPPPVIHP